jgi:hypothetical protein
MPGVENAMLALLLGSAVNSGGAKQPYEIARTAAVFSDFKFAPSRQKPVR